VRSRFTVSSLRFPQDRPAAIHSTCDFCKPKQMMSKPNVNIPMLDLQAQYASIASELDAALKEVLAGQQLILGPEVKKLERELADYCNCSHAIGCASGSDALLLALMAFDVGSGDEIITTPYTFFATVGSIVRLGARPIFVDIDPDTFNLNPADLAAAISPRTKAIIPIHLFGQCAAMNQIAEQCSPRNIPIIEDAAQAIGSEYLGTRAGSLGTVACFSFYPSKNLGGAGDGGLLTTDDGELADKLRVLRAHGAKKKYYHDYVGINSRLDSLQAGILRVKLRHLDDWTRLRRENAARYYHLFNATGMVDAGIISLPQEQQGQFHVYNQFVIRAKDRDRLRTYMKEQGIGSEVYYPVPMHLQPCFQSLGYRTGDFPESERAASESLAIPIYPELGEENQRYIVERIASFYN